jgi:signal transduction histidine kinase
MLVADAVDLMLPIAAEKSVQLHTEVAAGPPVPCDRRLIERVLSNLIHNAIKFTAQGGSVTLLVEREDGEVRFSVKDTGPGIASEQLQHLFEQYWQERPGRGGTGLGLYIARGIVEEHGGRIGADSQIGEGTVVWFTLPIQPTPEAHAEAALH